jgi:succinoglycan biosynthesis transport protein ExoP
MQQQSLEPQSGMTVDFLLGVLRHRWWQAVAGFVVVWAAITAIIWLIPPKYRSQATILIESQQVPSQYVVPNVTQDLQQRLDTLTQQILSRTRLLRIIDTFKLYPKDRTRLDNDALVDTMRKDIQIQLVVPTMGGGSSRRNDLTGFTIAYLGPTPALAQQVTAELTSAFIEQNIKSREQRAVDTTEFLQNQLDQSAKTVAEQEAKLRDFKSRYLGELPEQLQSNLTILSGLQARRQSESEAVNRAEQQQLYLESMINQYRTMAAASGQTQADLAADAVVPPALEQHLTEMQNALTQMSARYTPLHPDIIRLKEEIARTEQLKQSIISAAKKGTKPPEEGAAPAASQSNAPLVQMSMQLRAVQFDMAIRRKNLKDLDAQIGIYQARLNQTPVREQELSGLERDHQQSVANYNSLLSKKQQSELATNLEKRQQGEQFNLVDPPSLPKQADWPKRFKLSLIAIAAGLAVALGLIGLIEMSHLKIYGEEQLNKLAPIDVLVSVPPLWTAQEKRRLRRLGVLRAVTACVLVLLVPLGTVYSYFKG